MMVGRLLSFWEGNFSGTMLNFRWISDLQQSGMKRSRRLNHLEKIFSPFGFHLLEMYDHATKITTKNALGIRVGSSIIPQQEFKTVGDSGCCFFLTFVFESQFVIFGSFHTLSFTPPKTNTDPWKRRFPLETIISRFHVEFRGCMFLS